MVRPPGGRAVVVLADPACRDAVRRWLRDFSGDRVTVLFVGRVPEMRPGTEPAGKGPALVEVADLDDVVARLTLLNAQDIILVVLGSGVLVPLAGNHGRLFEQLFLHLRPGGAYLVDRTGGPIGNRGRADHGAPAQFHRMRAAAQRPDSGAKANRRTRVARFIKKLSVDDDLIVATKRGRHALKLREHQIRDLLPQREPGIDVSVMETRPSGLLSLQVEPASYGPSRAAPWREELEYPEMTLRHYEGDLVSAGGMRLYTGNTLLPESFRWPHARVARQPWVESVTPLFGRFPRRPPARVLVGDYYFLDCLFSGHFGHLTIEVLSRLWGWERAKREFPELKALFHTNPARGRDGSLEHRLFTAYGIPESDLVWSARPVRLRSVVGASPMWHNEKPYYAHPDIRETWARMTAGLLAGGDPAGHERIFVSRGASLSRRRGCRNQLEVERFFADRGFHVFYPEELPLAEQAALFAGARVVAGFAGSAMFNMMHAQRLESVVVISHNAYVARNEHLFASVLGAQLHYFWQPADVEQPKGKRSLASDRSSFEFDFATYGDDLGRVLGEL
jgi:capsular polysaccharide biosynthesis protein